MSKFPVMPHEQTIALITRYQQTGDQDAAAELVAANEGMIRQIVMQYARSAGDAEIDDLMQYGRMGLLRALESFEIERGLRFSTYAYHWIRQHITRFGRRSGQKISMSVVAGENRAKLLKARAEFEQANGREPTLAELSEITGIKRIDRLFHRVGSYDQFGRSEEGEDSPFIEKIPDEDADVEGEACHAADVSNDRRIILSVVRHLPANWRTVLTLRYGLDGSEPQTLGQCSDVMGLTRERIRQLEHQALASLKSSLEFRRKSGELGEF